MLKAMGYTNIPWNFKATPNIQDEKVEEFIEHMDYCCAKSLKKDAIINDAHYVSSQLVLYDANQFVHSALLPSLGYPSNLSFKAH